MEIGPVVPEKTCDWVIPALEGHGLKNIQTCWIWKRSYRLELFSWVKSLNDECSDCSLLERNWYQYVVHAKIIVFCGVRGVRGVHGVQGVGNP